MNTLYILVIVGWLVLAAGVAVSLYFSLTHEKSTHHVVPAVDVVDPLTGASRAKLLASKNAAGNETHVMNITEDKGGVHFQLNPFEVPAGTPVGEFVLPLPEALVPLHEVKSITDPIFEFEGIKQPLQLTVHTAYDTIKHLRGKITLRTMEGMSLDSLLGSKTPDQTSKAVSTGSTSHPTYGGWLRDNVQKYIPPGTGYPTI